MQGKSPGNEVELNGGVNAIKIRGESLKVINRMCLYHEDVVYVPPPSVWLVWST